MDHKIDEMILNKFQNVSNLFQEYFGIDNFKLAKLSIILVAIARILETVFEILKGISFSDVLFLFCLY